MKIFKRRLVNDSPYYLVFGWAILTPKWLAGLKANLDKEWQKLVKITRELDLAEARLADTRNKLTATQAKLTELESQLVSCKDQIEQLNKKKKKK